MLMLMLMMIDDIVEHYVGKYNQDTQECTDLIWGCCESVVSFGTCIENYVPDNLFNDFVIKETPQNKHMDRIS